MSNGISPSGQASSPAYAAASVGTMIVTAAITLGVYGTVTYFAAKAGAKAGLASRDNPYAAGAVSPYASYGAPRDNRGYRGHR